MSNSHVETTANHAPKQQSFMNPPVVLSIVMVSSGAFVYLLAQAISIFSTIGY